MRLRSKATCGDNRAARRDRHDGHGRALDADVQRIIARAARIAGIDPQLAIIVDPEARIGRAAVQQGHALGRPGNDLNVTATSQLDRAKWRNGNALGRICAGSASRPITNGSSIRIADYSSRFRYICSATIAACPALLARALSAACAAPWPQPLTIIGSFVSPYVRKVLACMNLKGLDYRGRPDHALLRQRRIPSA